MANAIEPIRQRRRVIVNHRNYVGLQSVEAGIPRSDGARDCHRDDAYRIRRLGSIKISSGGTVVVTNYQDRLSGQSVLT